MGNNIASTFVQRLRRSGLGTTLVSQTSTTPPLFLDPIDIPGVVRAYVVFDGYTLPNRICNIIKKSTNVNGVTAQSLRGDYLIEFLPGTFSDRDYFVSGNVYADSTDPISAANTFFVKGSGYSMSGFVTTGQQQTETFLRIQTLNQTNTALPAYARRVSLLFYK